MAEKQLVGWQVDRPLVARPWVRAALRPPPRIRALTRLLVGLVLPPVVPTRFLTAQESDTLLYLGIQWPPVGALLGNNFYDSARRPVSQNVMTRDIYTSVARRANSLVAARLLGLGYVVREVDDLGSPDAITRGSTFGLQGRLFELALDTRGRTVRVARLHLSVFWDVIDLRSGSVAWSKEFQSQYESELIGDLEGALTSVLTRGFRDVFLQLLADQGFLSLLASGAPLRSSVRR